MKEKKEIWDALLIAEKKARSGKFKRFIRSPFLYPSILLFNSILYPLLKRGIYIHAGTFFGVPIRTLLPSGTDIVLNGIKSHDSEIRLTKYLTATLREGDTFIDVGAHYGYYSLLASQLVGNFGKVISIEPSISSFSDLQENISAHQNIAAIQAAAGAIQGSITFYEYEGPFAEYNTVVPDAYVNQKWFNHVEQKTNTVPLLTLENIIKNKGIENAVIKIDVEGGEPSVLRGMISAIKEKNLIIAMEYLFPDSGSKHHQEAAKILYNEGYKSFAITREGELAPIPNIDDYLREMEINSDNIIFSNR